MKFDVYGRKIEIIQRDGGWLVLIPGNDGKKRLAEDLHIPSDIPESRLAEYLADLCHEWSRSPSDRITRLE